MKRNISVLIVLFYVILCSCATATGIKVTPAYKGVDPNAQKYVNEYMDLSRQNHIQFTGNVSIGFTKLNMGAAIGVCTDGLIWREIDLDRAFWASASPVSRRFLVYHELTHCYCGRDHDYGKGKKYASSSALRVAERFVWYVFPVNSEGYFEDGCALSIMHPVIQDDTCLIKHRDEYLKEMFNRCEPY